MKPQSGSFNDMTQRCSTLECQCNRSMICMIWSDLIWSDLIWYIYIYIYEMGGGWPYLTLPSIAQSHLTICSTGWQFISEKNHSSNGPPLYKYFMYSIHVTISSFTVNAHIGCFIFGCGYWLALVKEICLSQTRSVIVGSPSHLVVFLSRQLRTFLDGFLQMVPVYLTPQVGN